MQESTARVMELHEDEPEMVARMLLCLYTSDYPVNAHENRKSRAQSVEQLIEQGRTHASDRDYVFETNPYLVISKMYVLADKYDISALKELCVTKLKAMKLASKPDKLQSFLESLDHVYNSTPFTCSSLRIAAAGIVQKNYRDIMTDDTTKSKLRDACLANAQIGWVLFSMLFWARDLLCKNCDVSLRLPRDLADPDNLSEWYGVGDEVCLCGLTQVCGSKVCFTQVKKHIRCPDCLTATKIELVDLRSLTEDKRCER
jgi:hypothetical protein